VNRAQSTVDIPLNRLLSDKMNLLFWLFRNLFFYMHFSLPMRSMLSLACVLVFISSKAQSTDEFYRSHSYLIAVMQDAPASQERKGPWQLSRLSVAHFAGEWTVHNAFDPRLDLFMSTQIANASWNNLFSTFGDSSLADHALVYGPASTRRMLLNDSLKDAWPLEHRKWKRKRAIKWKEETALQMLEGPIDWQDLAVITYAVPEEFFQLNPAVSGKRLPKSERAWLRLNNSPNEKEIAMLHRKANLRDSIHLAELEQERQRLRRGIPDAATHDMDIYRVKSGDVLGSIARRFGVSVKELKKWNSLKSDRINIGQELTVYIDKGRSVAEVKTPKEVSRALDPKAKVRSDEEDRKEEYYEIQSGDTLWSIARNYPGVSADDIMRWNGIDENIKIGQVVLVLPPSSDSQL
jgi:LysM repeat protein